MLYTAIIMGLAGSLHCAGMCSPLALAMTKSKPFVFSSILYNSGRIFLYGIMGTVAASFGSLLQLGSYQQFITIALGAIFLIAGIGFRTMRIPFADKVITTLASYLKKAFGIVSGKKSGFSTFALGMLNGLLPCGLTYLALSACLILPSALDGLVFMLLFGLGTWPVMIGSVKLLSLLRNSFSLGHLSKIALVFIGCTLLIRVWWVHPHISSAKTPAEVNVCK
jgi:uncharacterized protein